MVGREILIGWWSFPYQNAYDQVRYQRIWATGLKADEPELCMAVLVSENLFGWIHLTMPR